MKASEIKSDFLKAYTNMADALYELADYKKSDEIYDAVINQTRQGIKAPTHCQIQSSGLFIPFFTNNGET
jgi:hypothetical protein